MAVNCTEFNHNGQLLISGAADGIIRLFGEQKAIAEQWNYEQESTEMHDLISLSLLRFV